MINAYIGIGSNLDDPENQVNKARSAIVGHPQFTELKFSSLYSSPPMGPQDQPHYVNAVLSVTTELTAIKMLRELQQIETDFGRVRTGTRWGARVLDLDLLLYSDQQINHPDLIVPHIGVAERAFVLYPLAEIAPDDLLITGQGTIKQLVSECPLNGLEKLQS